MNGNHHNSKPDQTPTPQEKLAAIYGMMDESAVFETIEQLIDTITTTFSDLKADAAMGSLPELGIYADLMATDTLRLSVLAECYARKVKKEAQEVSD